MTDDDPDPRFSLANERTFLAWIRTSLGMVAAAVGLVAVDLPWPVAAEGGLAVMLAAGSGAAALMGWSRWRRVEEAIAAGRAAPRPKAHVFLASLLGFVALAIVALILLG